MCILNTEGCNIFENLSSKDYTRCLDLMQDIILGNNHHYSLIVFVLEFLIDFCFLILATDLAHHLRIINKLKDLATNGFDSVLKWFNIIRNIIQSFDFKI